ncbi:hypothetical protein HELRODRAFT_94263 [Helobdella robusta]|uniref:Conserved oligomeric Golgi complex subunit 8 n=1 Tax=Helobdella robusta TaxID=6412 RepID=T1G8Z8_HELRO|nr:hypothetical protein HELRODRAFT_94263 [Helobdella robusta]ESO01844.1 hypothetical protein HELRODRAFT_94263 [Helobdella robusta]
MEAVDVEEDLVLASVFKDYLQDSYQDNSEFLVYLSELSSYGIAKLNSEPQRLAEEKAQILEETRSLAFHNYKTFIQTAECCKEIFQDFQIIEKHVGSMLQRLPGLLTSCATFLKQAQDINSSRKMNNLTLTKYSQLLEFLELPQLVDTCVRNEYYEETLELAEYVKRLEKKHSNIPIVQKIVEEVKLNMQQMLKQLLQQLRSNIQLPACLRILGYLRRMNIFTETQLRIKFLQTRDSWLQSVLNAIPKDDAYHHISKTIEASRVHLFDIITQYRAIFPDDDALYSSSSFLKEHHHNHPLQNVVGRQVNDTFLFHSWVLQKISNFLFVLENDLKRGGCGGSGGGSSGSLVNRLDSLLAQCMYFGLSFSRVGIDFRGLVVPVFEKASFRLFEDAVKAANNGLHTFIQSYSLLGSQPSSTTSTFHQMPSSFTGGTSLSLHLPPRLLQHPPLATFTNDILAAFNDLRLCAPYTLLCPVTDRLNGAMVRAVQDLLAFHKMDETTFTKQEMDRFVDMCCCFVDDLLPHINRCLQHLFPPAQIQALLGINLADNLAVEAGLGELDADKIAEPLKNFLPQPQIILPTVLPSPDDASTTITNASSTISTSTVTTPAITSTITTSISTTLTNTTPASTTPGPFDTSTTPSVDILLAPQSTLTQTTPANAIVVATTASSSIAASSITASSSIVAVTATADPATNSTASTTKSDKLTLADKRGIVDRTFRACTENNENISNNHDDNYDGQNETSSVRNEDDVMLLEGLVSTKQCDDNNYNNKNDNINNNNNNNEKKDDVHLAVRADDVDVGVDVNGKKSTDASDVENY